MVPYPKYKKVPGLSTDCTVESYLKCTWKLKYLAFSGNFYMFPNTYIELLLKVSSGKGDINRWAAFVLDSLTFKRKNLYQK